MYYLQPGGTAAGSSGFPSGRRCRAGICNRQHPDERTRYRPKIDPQHDLYQRSAIRLGRVVDNKMVDMKLSNVKLIDRGTRMVVQETGLAYEEAEALLLQHGSVREAVAAAESSEFTP